MRITGSIILSINADIPSADEIDASTDQQRTVLEKHPCRAAGRQGLRLEKSRRRDPRAGGYGTFMLTEVTRYLYRDRDGR